MGKFKYSNKFDSNQQRNVNRIIRNGVKENLTQKQIIKNLDDNNLHYWHTNVSYDIRRIHAGIYAESTSAKNDSYKWFDNVYEPFRKKHKLLSSQANELIYQMKIKSDKLTKMEIREYWELYHLVFS